MKSCNDCPFMKSSPLAGSPEWLNDVLLHAKNNPTFTHTCHKTDPKADGYNGSKEVRECRGHVRMLMNGFDRTPGQGGVWESYLEMAIAYAKKWKINLGV